jgi:RimJ/RimL family protein N-acetyltransferase
MNSDSPIALETDRLLLRPWRLGDAGVEHELWTERDPRVPPHRRIGPDGHPTVADLEERMRTEGPPDRLGVLAIEGKGSGEVIGYAGLIENSHGPADEPMLAFELLRRAWGRGYATEASSAVLDWARASEFRRLWATVRVWNTASRRVLSKLGFVETGRVERDDVYGDNLFTSRLL